MGQSPIENNYNFQISGSVKNKYRCVKNVFALHCVEQTSKHLCLHFCPWEGKAAQISSIWSKEATPQLVNRMGWLLGSRKVAVLGSNFYNDLDLLPWVIVYFWVRGGERKKKNANYLI